jgi:hypothetical protein
MKKYYYSKSTLAQAPWLFVMIDEPNDFMVSVYTAKTRKLPEIGSGKTYDISGLNPIECSKEEFQLAYNNALEKLIEYGDQL